MLNNITNIVRSNKNAVMVRIGNGSASSAIYTIFDIKSQSNTYTGSLSSVKRAWSGLNHRFMGA